MSDSNQVPVLTDLVVDENPNEPTIAPTIDTETIDAIKTELNEFMHGTLRNQMSRAMEEVIDDLCKQANEKLEALLDKHLGK